MLHFGTVCVYEKRYIDFKRNQPFVFTLPYQWARILFYGVRLPDGWFEISGHSTHTETESVLMMGSSLRAACYNNRHGERRPPHLAVIDILFRD